MCRCDRAGSAPAGSGTICRSFASRQNVGRNTLTTVILHASWGDPIKEKESGEYSIWITKLDGSANGGMARLTARAGVLKLGGKEYAIAVGENTSDGIYTVPADGDMTRMPVTLYVDAESGKPFDPKSVTQRTPLKFDMGHPFELDGHWYIARPSVSGATLTVQETAAPGTAAAAPPAVAPDITPVGSKAPDFDILSADGKPLRLSDFKGKIVILDFWATWCGPCQKSMPSLEALRARFEGDRVVVLSVNVLDEKAPFDEWMAKHAGVDYHFTFARDPAGKDDGIANILYGVPAIPAWFLIDADGTIAAKDIGFSGDQARLIEALRKLDVTLKKSDGG